MAPQLRRLTCLFVLLAACTTERASPNSTAVKAVVPTAPLVGAMTTPISQEASTRPAAPSAPLHVSWVKQSDEGGDLRLLARVEYLGRFPVPLNVRVLAPDGVERIEGPQAFTLAATDGPVTRDTGFVFRYRATPQKDLLLVADAQTPGFGVHAEDAYRFGRSRPAAPQPQATGPELVVGSRSFGRSIPLQADKSQR